MDDLPLTPEDSQLFRDGAEFLRRVAGVLDRGIASVEDARAVGEFAQGLSVWAAAAENRAVLAEIARLEGEQRHRQAKNPRRAA